MTTATAKPTETRKTRVTSFMIRPSGARSFGLSVRGIQVLVTAGEGQHDLGLALAEQIAELGPEAGPVVEDPTTPESLPVAQVRATPRQFQVGDRVWCKVHGAQGFCTITEVGAGRNRGCVKISGYRPWCPAFNFEIREG